MNENTIAEKLVRLRGVRTREEVADALDISISALQMYENGKRVPRDEIKVAIARYYNTTVQDLFFDDKYTFRVQRPAS